MWLGKVSEQRELAGAHCFSATAERERRQQAVRGSGDSLLGSVLNTEVERYASVVSAENTNEGVYNRK